MAKTAKSGAGSGKSAKSKTARSARAGAAKADAANPTDPRRNSAEPAWPRSRDGRPRQFSVPAELVEHILLGPADDRRVLQDSPLLGDVWAAFALDPGVVRDVLITPHKNTTAATVAGIIPDGRSRRETERAREQNPSPAPRPKERAKIAYLQGLVGARLYFDEVLRILVPLTQWWAQPKVRDRLVDVDEDKLERLLRLSVSARDSAAARENYSSLERYIALAGLIYWIGKLERPDDYKGTPYRPLPPLKVDDAFGLYQDYVPEIIKGMFELYGIVQADKPLGPSDTDDDQRDIEARSDGLIFQVSLNRNATAALDRSVAAVKADAAQSLFKVSCRKIVWAVLDSGIDGNHPAFQTPVQPVDPATGPQFISRARKTFDFTNIREIVSNDASDLSDNDVQALATKIGRSVAEVRDLLRLIAQDAADKRPINWAAVEKLITLKNPPKPPNPHGTHVAGIIGASRTDAAQVIAARADRKANSNDRYLDGMCPDIRLYDFRVLGKSAEDTEFSVIAALQYIRYVNERQNFITIHGANLSLSIPHNVRNYACGRTPVCNECERLVESGVAVVAAAGNRGYQKFETASGPFENYAAFSITDPGNGEGVITVGSTHGGWPQTYGVSFFSSRGPTGDGRLKPDLVAPGERVISTVLDEDWAPESGTSMAAPHVSGAAAMLMARYDELVGQPRRIKKILCDSATDLGREKTFQGHGMLDVLRAFQSI
jgi:hypothetical protein